MAMPRLSFVHRVFSSKNPAIEASNDSSFNVQNAAPTWLEKNEIPPQGRAERSLSQAEMMEQTDPKHLACIESVSSINAPMQIDGRGRRPSSFSDLEHFRGSLSEEPQQIQGARSPDERDALRIEPTQESHRRHSRSLIVKSLLLVYGAAVMIILALALGLGLGLGLRREKLRVNVPMYGAINGSGIVALDLDNTTKITSYTQRYDGVIVRSEYQDGNWSGGTDIGDIVTANGNFDGESLAARNGTPLMALSYVNDAELSWHVFYVTVDGYLSDWINSNITNNWFQGTLRSGNFAVSNSSHVGLSACVNTEWYGAPYDIAGLGIRLYYGRSDNIIQELGWNLNGQTTWFNGSSFPNSNGAGGVECTVRGASITYVWMENLQGELQQMWYDFNLSAGTSNHTVGKWVSGLTYPDILHNSAVSAINDFTATPPTKNVHFQAPDMSIVEIISNGTAENDTWERHFTVGTENGMNGTRIGSVVLDTGLGGQEIHVIYQTNSTDMIDFIRDLTSPNWAIKPVPVGV